MSAILSLTSLTLTPLIGGVILTGLEASQARLVRRLALFFHALVLVQVILIASGFDVRSGEIQWVERVAWIPSLHAEYHLGIDGLGLLMILLAALVVPMGVLFTTPTQNRPPLYYALFLFLQGGVLGAFTALNFVHWFLFWELSLVPAYFLIKLWGGSRRAMASRLFFIYTMVGSVTLLLSFLAVGAATGTLDFLELAERGRGLEGGLAAIFNVRLGWHSLSTEALALIIFGGAFLGFAVKIPIWPFQSWLPVTYGEAPTAVSAVLTGVLSKLGLYGLLRIILPIFPEQLRWVQTPLLWLAVVSIVFSALAAVRQTDLKRILGHLSVSHLGYCCLGVFAAVQITPEAPRWTVEKSAVLSGVVLQMFNHGILSATLFGLVAWMEDRRGRSCSIDDFGGLREVAPVFCGVMGIVTFGSLGLPGLSGFVGEFLIFKGALGLSTWAAVLSVAGLLVTAILLLGMTQRIWHGPLRPPSRRFRDLGLRERWVVAVPLLLVFGLGVYPQAAMIWMNATVVGWVERLNS